MRRLVLLLLAVPAGACNAKKDDQPEPVWVQFNADADVLPILVLPEDDEPGDEVRLDLTSSTGHRTVGVASVSPGAAPIGSTHTITVDISAAYAKRVELVQVIAETGDGESWTIALRQDSADPGLWVRSVVSHGEVDAPREDLFAFVLWERDDNPPPAGGPQR